MSNKPVLQVALDFLNLSRALKVAQEAVKGGVDIIELGTPLIKSEGLNAVREIRKLFPKHIIVADMKTMDAGRTEVEAAAKSGADIVCVLAAATDATIKECVKAGKNYGAKIQADLIGIKDTLKRAKKLESLGVDIIGVHCAIDEQMQGKEQFNILKQLSKEIKLPLAIAGGITSETVLDAIKAGANTIIVGGFITKSPDAKKAVKDIKKVMKSKKAIKPKYFKRESLENISKVLKKVSTANVSDAMHRKVSLEGIYPVFSNKKIFGKVITVRTFPGDWAKPVEAVDKAEAGDIIVIDAGGVGPALWGELATHGAIQKKIAGIVVNGAVRDTQEIEKMGFAVYSKLVMSNAGEPKGFGEIGVTLNIGGVSIQNGDWAVCDDDGVVIIAKDKVVEVANRAMNVLETENRLRKEIDKGKTLAEVTELLRWEKAR